MIVERGVALAYRLEFVVEVDHNLAKWQHKVQFHAVAADVFLVDELAALVEAECHDRTNEVCRGDD